MPGHPTENYKVGNTSPHLSWPFIKIVFSVQPWWIEACFILKGLVKVGLINWKVVSNGRVYLFRKPVKYFHCCSKTGSFLFCHSVVSACLPPQSLRNPLTYHVAMTSAEDVGRGKTCFGLACGIASG